MNVTMVADSQGGLSKMAGNIIRSVSKNILGHPKCPVLIGKTCEE